MSVVDEVKGTRDVVPVQCINCGYDDHGTLVLEDAYLRDWPPIPRWVMSPFDMEVHGAVDHEGEPTRTECPVCDEPWLPDGVVTRTGQEQRR